MFCRRAVGVAFPIVLGQVALAQSTTTIAPGSAPAISSDARYVAFTSSASGLVPNDNNLVADVFVWDRTTGSIERVSLSSTGAEANGPSDHPSISADGRFVAFDSTASNLLSTPSSGLDVFIRDRLAETTVCASVSYDTGLPVGGSSPSLSADGQFVAFEGGTSKLVPNTANLVNDTNVFLRDLAAGVTVLASPLGLDIASRNPALSADGVFVAFESDAQGGSWWNVYRFSIGGGLEALTSTGVSPGPPPQFAHCDQTSISADGRFVAFRRFDPSTNGMTLLMLLDTATTTFEVVTVGSNGSPAYGMSSWPRVSQDAQFVAFTSSAPGLPLGGLPMGPVYVRDRVAGTTLVASVHPSGYSVSGTGSDLDLSGSGRFVVFREQLGPLYLRDMLVCPDIATYCTAGTTTNGCTPAIAAMGTASATSPDGFTITVGNVEGQRNGLIFYGLAPTSQPWGLGSSSYLCILSPVARTGVQQSGGTEGGCDGALVLDWNAWRATHPNSLGSPFTAGDVFYAQGWFRDAQAVKGTNLSDALSFTLCD